jgi:hypothetical protein
VIYVYAIAEREEAPLVASGLGGAPVERVTAGSLAALVSREPVASVEPSERALWEHEAVVEEMMDAGPVLPMRFGSTVRDEGSLRDVLRTHSDEFARALDRVRGRVEMGLRAIGEPAGTLSPAPAASGRGYLLEKLERRQAAARAADAIDPAFAELAVASSQRLLPSEGVVFTAAYLVDRSHIDEFERRAEHVDVEREDIELVPSGPWPPYNFTRHDDA